MRRADRRLSLAALLDGLEPLSPIELPLAEAAGCIAAGTPLLAAYPPLSRYVAAVGVHPPVRRVLDEMAPAWGLQAAAA